jgi:hypothetical protein
VILQAPTSKQLKIRRLVKNFGQCVWCQIIANATPDELALNLYFIPRPSLPHCDRHRAINSAYTLAIGRANSVEEINLATETAYRKGYEVMQIHPPSQPHGRYAGSSFVEGAGG